MGLPVTISKPDTFIESGQIVALKLLSLSPEYTEILVVPGLYRDF